VTRLPRPVLLVAGSWLLVVAVAVVVRLTWDLEYEPGGCSDVLTSASRERFEDLRVPVRGAQWLWAVAVAALLLRWRALSPDAPPTWRTALATPLLLLVAAYSGILLLEDPFVVIIIGVIAGAVALVGGTVVLASLLARRERPTGMTAAFVTWLLLCVAGAPLGLGLLTANEESTLC
jgi:hypothetical protein